MKTRWFTTAVGAAVALALGIAPAMADDKAKTTGAGSEQHKATGGAKTDGAASPKMESGSGDFSGRHTMEGEVTRVDQTKGTLSLKTAEGMMDLHFPPSALSNVKKGDHVAVELALKPSAGAASPGTSGSSSSSGSSAGKSSSGSSSMGGSSSSTPSATGSGAGTPKSGSKY
jgi:type IV secretion system protein TrbL